jgi:hypothetical protein
LETLIAHHAKAHGFAAGAFLAELRTDVADVATLDADKFALGLTLASIVPAGKRGDALRAEWAPTIRALLRSSHWDDIKHALRAWISSARPSYSRRGSSYSRRRE